MQISEVNYKGNLSEAKIASCLLDLNFFKKLFNTLKEINQKAADLEVSKLEKKPNTSDADFLILKETITNSFKIIASVFGSQGQHIAKDSDSLFEESHLPDYITKVIFDSSIYFKSLFKDNPQNSIRIEFDFTKPSIFDFITNPSESTPNNSFIQVTGNDDIWVTGSYNKILPLLKGRNTKRAWLHQKNVYDLFLWFLIIPLAFRNLYKIDISYLSQTSNVFLVAVYLYLFIIILWLYRMLFNYTKWIFPYLELSTSLKKTYLSHRLFLTSLCLAITYGSLKDYFFSLIKYLF